MAHIYYPDKNADFVYLVLKNEEFYKKYAKINEKFYLTTDLTDGHENKLWKSEIQLTRCVSAVNRVTTRSAPEERYI